MLSLYLSVIEDHQYDNKFEKIYYRYKNMLFAVAMGILKDETYAEEAVQDTLFAIASNIENIDDENEKMLKSYLFVIARNKSYNLYNKRSLNSVINIDEINHFDNNCDLVTMLEEGEEYTRLVSAILSLPLIYRETLSLYYIYEFTPSEISRSLNIPKDTVKSRIKRGKEQLLKLLGEEVWE